MVSEKLNKEIRVLGENENKNEKNTVRDLLTSRNMPWEMEETAERHNAD